MADEQQTTTEQTQESVQSPAPSPSEEPDAKPSGARSSVGSVVMAAFMIVFGAAAWFGVGYLKVALLGEDVGTGLLAVLTFGALLAGVIVGGIIGAKVKRLISK